MSVPGGTGGTPVPPDNLSRTVNKSGGSVARIVGRRVPLRNTFIMWLSLPLAAALAGPVADGQPPSGKAELVYPLVSGHGGVVPLPRAAEQPRKGTKAVFDIAADAKPGEVNRGLDRVARLLNLYGAAGLKAGDVKITAVLHGEANKAVLSDTAYAARFKVAANANLPLIRALKEAGAEVFVCGQSLHELGYKTEEVAKEVPVADSAMLVLVNKETGGYAYIPSR
jgi:intracellular sulfur oxidation DsrE/DsrF family protein